MAVNNIIKRIQNIMRSDAGINGDAQRIEQMTWMFFLKVYDTQEEQWEYKASKDKSEYVSIIPEPLRWRNWAIDEKDGKAMTGDTLLNFVNNTLFPVLKGSDVDYEGDTLKGIFVDATTPRSKSVVVETFADLNQYMKDGTLLRQVVNIINEIEFDDAEDRHTFGDIYEGILKDLQSAGNAGEFYTPRALTDFIVKMIDPKLGETFGDFTSGTGGFLTSALNHLAPQVKSAADNDKFQKAVVGQEWKPLPYLLSITNLLLHDIESPNIRHCDSLGVNVSDFKESDKVDVIGMNPPYGGSTGTSVQSNFPSAYRSSETADLFIALIMYRLKAGGRCGVIIPDGFLFGTDGAKKAIKESLLRKFNLHTIIRLPGSIFSPYTSINTNILFFNNEKAEGAEEGFNTKETWFYRMDMPEGYKHFSKTKPMKLEHTQPIQDWWADRKEIVSDELGEKSRVFTAQQLLDLDCNFDQCKFPKDEEEVLPPAELLRQYHEKRNALDAKIDNTLSKIQDILGISIDKE
ncbi:MAG: type I restriction-modification system subunit M [Paludibacteraceae bacterium]|nr:type I restriction-modification system subunit M [Paludibacteraceae bacterium]